MTSSIGSVCRWPVWINVAAEILQWKEGFQVCLAETFGLSIAIDLTILAIRMDSKREDQMHERRPPGAPTWFPLNFPLTTLGFQMKRFSRPASISGSRSSPSAAEKMDLVKGVLERLDSVWKSESVPKDEFGERREQVLPQVQGPVERHEQVPPEVQRPVKRRKKTQASEVKASEEMLHKTITAGPLVYMTATDVSVPFDIVDAQNTCNQNKKPMDLGRLQVHGKGSDILMKFWANKQVYSMPCASCPTWGLLRWDSFEKHEAIKGTWLHLGWYRTRKAKGGNYYLCPKCNPNPKNS